MPAGPFGLVLGVLALAGCGGAAPAAPTKSADASQVPTAPAEARAQLAARAAAAQDRRMVASYRLLTPGEAERTVSVTLATDGTWRVDVARGALGGTTDVSVVRTKDGLYQCAPAATDSSAGASTDSSAAAPTDPSTPASTGQSTVVGCVRVAGPDGRLRPAHDPRVEHVFTDWLAVLTDQRAALAVSPAKPIKGVRGACFSVESSSASLAAPLDLGIYCYDQDGTLTGAALGFGTLVLDGTPGGPPATVSLPGPVVGGRPLPTASPSPSDSPSPSGSRHP
jgi:hypothetical protein